MAENVEKKKSGKGKTVAIILLIIALIAAIGYIAYLNGIISYNEETKKVVVSTKKKKKTKTEKEINLAKPLNTKDIKYSEATLLSNKIGKLGVSISVNKDKRAAQLIIDWTKLCNYITQSSCPTITEKYSIKGFSKKINKGYFGSIGTELTGNKMFFVMENNTVEYLNFIEKDKDGKPQVTFVYKGDTAYLKSKGAIKGVTGVVKLYSVTAKPNKKAAYKTVAAKKLDGSFYDLGAIIK